MAFAGLRSQQEIDDVIAYMKAAGGGGQPTPGNDTITGTPGPDTIRALAGNDQIDGLGGNDTIYADAGNDVVTGNVGVDDMTGGAGSDRFRYAGTAATGYHSGVGAGRRDRIRDFGAGDKIDLASVDANATLAGDQSFQFIAGAPFSRPGQLRWQYVGAGTLIQLSTDADTAPEFEIELTTRVALTAARFNL
jgi:Ca2+-binding RTX toxin-like protein